jgi:hypothetical protein
VAKQSLAVGPSNPQRGPLGIGSIMDRGRSVRAGGVNFASATGVQTRLPNNQSRCSSCRPCHRGAKSAVHGSSLLGPMEIRQLASSLQRSAWSCNMRRGRVRVVTASTTSSILLLWLLHGPGMGGSPDGLNLREDNTDIRMAQCFRGRGQLIVAVETQDAGVCGSF